MIFINHAELPSLSRILGYLTLEDIGRACMVCKAWRSRIEGDETFWRDLLIQYSFWYGGESEANFCKMLIRNRRGAVVGGNDLPLAHPYKILFRSRYLTRTRWINNLMPKHISFPVHGHSVVTAMLFSQNRIITASDDHHIYVHDPSTGRLLQSLEGHEGGVWALAVHGNLLVSGSTDRTARVWDLQDGRCLHVFGGHTSTVRCVAIIKPEWIIHPQTGKREKWPKSTVIVTGSRDHTLRIWSMPKRGESQFMPDPGMDPFNVHHSLDTDSNPYHLRLLSGHTHAIRSIAAKGRTLVSGSYDCTVRVWDIHTGAGVFTLTGHTQKVYSVVLDLRDGDGRAASGSMDGTVRLWSLTTGECLHVLLGHTSLIGLLGISPSYLVSAAADSTLRVWDARRTSDVSFAGAESYRASNNLLRGVIAGHTGAITCFQHDEWKVVSGSDGTLTVWDIRSLQAVDTNVSATTVAAVTKPIADTREGGFPTSWNTTGTIPVARHLFTSITGVWQVVFEGRWCVAASNRADITTLDVWDFSKMETAQSLSPETDKMDAEVEQGKNHAWTWEDEEWIGEPAGGVYDYSSEDE